MQQRRFFRLVQEAIDSLPSPYRDWLDNVDIVVERRPSRHQRRVAGLAPGETIFGLYEGVPLTERSMFDVVLPDKITIFQEPLEEAFGDDAEELVREVRNTVLHELAHHFGISDEELEGLELE